MYIPDPTEIMDYKIDQMIDNYVDENTCMICGKKCDYDVFCVDPMGMSPLHCVECAGFDPYKTIDSIGD